MAITAKKKANEREVEMMVGKAMCAYANWKQTEAADYNNPQFRHVSQYEVMAAQESEYETTCRCIAMFTVEHLPEVCQTIIDRAKSEFGL